eukprot:1156229-Pelagomonas_calceolata.AAC.10
MHAPVQLDQCAALALHCLGHQLVIRAHLPAPLHRPVTVLHAAIKLVHLKVNRSPAGTAKKPSTWATSKQTAALHDQWLSFWVAIYPHLQHGQQLRAD